MPRSPDAEPKPTLFVLYGATGDLCKRMVLPAFFQLWQKGLMPKEWRLIGNGRGDVAHEEFRKHFHDALVEFGPKPKRAEWAQFKQRLYFAGGGFNTKDPGSLLDMIAQQRKQRAQLIHYFAVPPNAFIELTRALEIHGLAKGARVVYEKPYGTSPDGFAELDREVHKVLGEDQVFRIDHFLGKEGAQDIHLARLSNRMLSAIWSRQHIRAVQVDVPETLDVKDRADFYDHTGATLDMLVTHLFQLVADLAMEPPRSLQAKDVQRARSNVMRAFRALDPREVVLGQFKGYRSEKGIKRTSTMDTLVAARLWIDNRRWKGVPFLLRTGKMMAISKQQVTLLLRDVDGPFGKLAKSASSITFSLSGSGELDFSLALKQPGPGMVLEEAKASVPLEQLPKANPLPPYVRLIHDVMMGDRSLFTDLTGLREVWRVAGPLLKHRPKVLPYAAKTFGPEKANALAAPDGWRLS
jgi:glucose-6-phosphate 1-dehydrogenase